MPRSAPRKPATIARKSPKQERSRATMEAIVEAGARVLVERGWAGTSTNRIAAKAGVAIGTLYQFFPSKEAIVGALVDRHVDGQLALVGEQLAARPDDPIGAVIEALFEGAARAGKLHVVLLGLIGHVERAERLRDVERQATGLLAAALTAKPELAAAHPDPQAAARILVRAVAAIILSFVSGELEDLSRERAAAQTIALVRRFLVP
jgi:AcrR family transcriptional regulator